MAVAAYQLICCAASSAQLCLTLPKSAYSALSATQLLDNTSKDEVAAHTGSSSQHVRAREADLSRNQAERTDSGAPAVDVLFDGQEIHVLESKRVHTHNTHGTGKSAKKCCPEALPESIACSRLYSQQCTMLMLLLMLLKCIFAGLNHWAVSRYGFQAAGQKCIHVFFALEHARCIHLDLAAHA